MKQFLATMLVLLLIAGCVFSFVFLSKTIQKDYTLIKENLPSYEKADEALIYRYPDEEMILFVNDEQVKLDYYPRIENGITYYPVELINLFLDDNFFWDDAEQKLTYTTINKVFRMKTEDTSAFVNDEPMKLPVPVETFGTHMAYVPAELLNRFVTFQQKSNSNRWMHIETVEKSYETATITGFEPYIRLEANRKSDFVRLGIEGEVVRVIEEVSQKETDTSGNITEQKWTLILSNDGAYGYVKSEQLGVRNTIAGKAPTTEIATEHNPKKNFDGKIVLAWHQVTNMTANQSVAEKTLPAFNLDVISPTWFAIIDNDGELSSLADRNYVDLMHSKGIQVWPLISNSFDKALTHEVLKSTEKREKVIKQLLALSVLYNFDGINVDFENVGKDDGVYFVQFIKELVPYCRAQGLIISADMYVPAPWTQHYGRATIGEILDYVMVMTYDEHWSTSPESGSVASFDFVKKGITDTLMDIQKEKIIMGLPFYTRLWNEETIDGVVNVTSKAYGMEAAKNILDTNKSDITWLDDIKQNYGEYEADGITHKIWLEDDRSISEKMSIMTDYDLAGVAAWKIGLETPSIWQVIENASYN